MPTLMILCLFGAPVIGDHKVVNQKLAANKTIAVHHTNGKAAAGHHVASVTTNKNGKLNKMRLVLPTIKVKT